MARWCLGRTVAAPSGCPHCVGPLLYGLDVTAMIPSNALDPQVMLATAVHAQPGVYALLLGSGVSTGAGVPTGWGVVRELIRRAAAAQAPDDETAAHKAHDDPESWWIEHGGGEPLGYSNLLAALAPTPAARQALLAGFSNLRRMTSRPA